ncbi:MAG: sulfite exporter TauE/SafE family protein [Bacteroidota bacterium]
MFLWTAFTIGLFGSLHCAGMCAPIAMALPGGSRQVVLRNGLLYNLGRTLTYTLLGGLIGLAGKGLYLAGLQKTLSIGLGVALLAVALFSINVESKLVKLGFFNRLVFKLKAHLGKFIGSRKTWTPLVVGILNGLLPCGLVYMAIVGALSTGGALSGMSYMALFGLGTVPMMLIAGLAGNLASLRVRNFLRKAYPAFLVFFALLFLFRGLNFHVPGDFFFWEKMEDVPMCH